MSADFPAALPRAEALERLAAAFRAGGFDAPRMVARRLLADACGMEPGEIVLAPDRPIGAAAHGLGPALARALTGEPITRIAGARSFYGRDFRVTPDVLDPRPETEGLVEAMLMRLADRPAPRILDLGTGSGAILVSLLAERTDATGLGVDICPSALAVACENAGALGVGARAAFRAGDLFVSLEGEFDAIVSNPPYIPTGDLAGLERAVRDFDPPLALDGGPDGLAFYRRIVAEAPRHLRAGGWLGLEIGAGQAEAVRGLIAAAGFGALAEICDFAGHIRHILAQGRARDESGLLATAPISS